MVWRILVALLKSAFMVAVVEMLSPIGEAIGLQLTFVAKVAKAISQATAIPYREAEILFLFVLIATLSQIARAVWDTIAD